MEGNTNFALNEAAARASSRVQFLKESAIADAVVLLVEADAAVAGQIEGLLSQDVFALQTAASIFQARKMIDCGLPDIILLDHKLPDGDGIALCAELRAQGRTHRVPILLMGGFDTASECVRGLKAGGDDYVVRPFHPEELFTRFAALLRRVRRIERT